MRRTDLTHSPIGPECDHIIGAKTAAEKKLAEILAIRLTEPVGQQNHENAMAILHNAKQNLSQNTKSVSQKAKRIIDDIRKPHKCKQKTR